MSGTAVPPTTDNTRHVLKFDNTDYYLQFSQIDQTRSYQIYEHVDDDKDNFLFRVSCIVKEGINYLTTEMEVKKLDDKAYPFSVSLIYEDSVLRSLEGRAEIIIKEEEDGDNKITALKNLINENILEIASETNDADKKVFKKVMKAINEDKEIPNYEEMRLFINIDNYVKKSFPRIINDEIRKKLFTTKEELKRPEKKNITKEPTDESSDSWIAHAICYVLHCTCFIELYRGIINLFSKSEEPETPTKTKPQATKG